MIVTKHGLIPDFYNTIGTVLYFFHKSNMYSGEISPFCFSLDVFTIKINDFINHSVTGIVEVTPFSSKVCKKKQFKNLNRYVPTYSQATFFV